MFGNTYIYDEEGISQNAFNVISEILQISRQSLTALSVIIYYRFHSIVSLETLYSLASFYLSS